MELQKNVSYKNRLKRLAHQLSLSEQLMQNHPSVKEKWGILHTLLHGFNLQMQWTLAGPSARLLMTFQSALQAQGTEQSQTGFVGPAMQRLQQSASLLMEASLYSNERDLAPLLLAFTQVISLTTIYVSTQLLENWKIFFPQDEDPIAAKKAGLLLKELGLTFLLGTRTAESAFHSIGQGLGLTERSQKRVTNIGMCFLLILLIMTEEREDLGESEWLETIKRFLLPTLESVEISIQEAEAHHLIMNNEALLAMNQVHLIRQALETSNGEALKQALETSFENLGISFEEVKKDVQRLSAFCAQLNKSFRNIFGRTAMTTTTIQAA